MSYALTVPTQTVGTYEPRTPSPLARQRLAEERGLETPQVLMIEAPPVQLSIVLRAEPCPQPEALWHKLSGQERYPRAEDQEGDVTWEQFFVTMGQFLQHMVNCEFRLMNETFAGVVEQLSVRDRFFAQAGEYMMGEMRRLGQRVEELETPDVGDPMDIFIDNVEPILPTPNYHRQLLEGISLREWTLATPRPKAPREKRRKEPYSKRGSGSSTPDPNRKSGSRASTPAPRLSAPTGIVAPLALPALSDAPDSSLDYSEEASAYSGDSPNLRPSYPGPSSVVQRLTVAADNFRPGLPLRPGLPRSTSLVTSNQPIPSQSIFSRYPAPAVPPPQAMPGREVPPTPPVSVATAPGDNVGSRERPVLLVPETPAQRPAFSDLPQAGTRAPQKPAYNPACRICGQRQHASGVCPTLIQCDLCGGQGHYEFDCPYARCDIFQTKGNRHCRECPLHPLNILCTVCGQKTHAAWEKGTCETYPMGKNPVRTWKGKGLFGAAGESSGAGGSGQAGDPGFGQGGNPQPQPQPQPQPPPQGNQNPGGTNPPPLAPGGGPPG